MLTLAKFAPLLVGGGSGGQNLKEIIDALGIGASLVLCLDAAAAASYDGSSQTWTDLSGSSNSFLRGTTSAATATDPTFNGSAGGASANEYFSSDGGDLFREASDLSFANSWHANNAAFTFAAIAYLSNSGNVSLFSTVTFVSDALGLNIFVNTQFGAGKIGLWVRNGESAVLSSGPSFTPVSSLGWYFIALSINEAGGATGGIGYVNGTASSTFGVTYTDPGSAGNPNNAYEILGDAGASKFPSGNRVAGVMAWNRALSSTELGNLYTQIKAGRPGYSLP